MMVSFDEAPAGRRRDTRSFLRPVAHFLVECLGLKPPTTSAPGHWCSSDGFVRVGTGLLKDGFRHPRQALRTLVSFEPRDVDQMARARIEREIPDFDAMPKEERRSVWSRVLQIKKHARTERVSEIVQELDRLGIELPTHTIVVHRVSNTFFANLDLETLRRLVALRESGYLELKRINIEKVA